MATLHLSFQELADLVLGQPNLPPGIKNVYPDGDVLIFNVRPLRIAPAVQVSLRIGEYREDSILHCPLVMPKHMKWLLRHIITTEVSHFLTVNETGLDVNVGVYLRHCFPGIKVSAVEKTVNGITLVLSVERRS
ncbi:MAG: hypothetical protein M5R41_17090 [Bacteroidia bacterium]|nr:hypothetical protein [Bacteroidia bacterium]